MRGGINIDKGVSSQKDEKKYWTNGFYSLVNTLDKVVDLGITIFL